MEGLWSEYGRDAYFGLITFIHIRRQRIWGSLSMTQSFMGDKQCWMEHMALNSTDGLDPEGIRLRASEGLLGVDYFFPGYAVWAGLIEAAADLGYDTNNLVRPTS